MVNDETKKKKERSGSRHVIRTNFESIAIENVGYEIDEVRSD